MRTTIDLPDALYRRAKLEAIHRGLPLRALIEVAVARELSEPTRDAPRFRPEDLQLVKPQPGLVIDPTKEQLDDWL